MKKAAYILSIILSLCLSVTTVSAEQEKSDTSAETIFNQYMDNEHILESVFGDDSSISYWHFINETSDNSLLVGILDLFSGILQKTPDEKEYAEILSNLIIMQSGELAEQIQNQNQFDDKKNYALDVLDIVSGLSFDSALIEDITSILNNVSGISDLVIKNKEAARYYETSIRDYSQPKQFLEAVNTYAETEELKTTASKLLHANDRLLQSRIEYLTDISDELTEFQAEYFFDNLSFDLLKLSRIYASDETVRWFVDCGETLSQSVQSIFAPGEFAFKMTMLAGDIGFGTSDIYYRYQEMKVIAEIADALTKANGKIKTPTTYDEQDALSKIEQKANYYKMLIVVHARGEYLAYQLVQNESGLLSDFRKLFENLKETGETTDDWYNNQVDTLMKYHDVLNSLTTSINTIETAASESETTENKTNTTPNYSPNIPGGSGASTETNLWQSLTDEYEFFTGAGGKISTMNIYSDGSFDGLFVDYSSLRGEIPPVPFHGKFSTPTQTAAYTYTTTLEEINIDGNCSDNLREYIISSHHFETGNEMVIFLPGISFSNIPQSYEQWFDLMYDAFVQSEDVLPFQVIMCSEHSGYLPSEYY